MSADIGAFEAGNRLPVTTLVDELDAGDTAGHGRLDDLSLREALAMANTDPTPTPSPSRHADRRQHAGVDDGLIELGGTELDITNDVTIDGDVNGDGDADITSAATTPAASSRTVVPVRSRSR